MENTGERHAADCDDPVPGNEHWHRFPAALLVSNRSVVVFMLAACLCLGGISAAWAYTPRAAIMGVVVDASNNSVPCTGVFVQFDPFVPGNTMVAATDALGRYVFENYPVTGTSPHQLIAVKPGYAISFGFYDAPPFVENGSNTLNVSLYRGCTLMGQVVDAKSNLGLANIKVAATWPGIHELVMGVTYTAADGSYVLANIHAGVDDLVVSDPLYVTVQRPNLVCPDQVTLGQNNFALHPGGTLSGTVCDFMGNPLGNPSAWLGVKVDAYADNGNVQSNYEAYVNTSGAYAFTGVPIGGYSLRVTPPLGANLQIVDVGGISVQQGTPAVRNFSLQPGGTLSGTVLWPSGDPAAGVWIWVCTDSQYPFSSDFSQQTNAAGVYAIQGLSPEQNYTVMAYPLNNTACAISLKRHVSVAENAVAFWNITLGTGGGRQGMILNPLGAPAYPASILAINGQLGLPQSVTVTGAYTLSNLPPGDYYFGISPANQNLQFLVRTLHVTTGLTDTFSLQLPVGGCLEGYVTSTAGVPLMNAKVSARDPMNPFAGSPGFEFSSYTDENGHYRIQGLSSGAWDMQVSPDLEAIDGFSPVFASRVPVTAGSTGYRNFELTQDGQQVKGTVRDQAGNRVMNALVQFWSASNPTQRGLAATNLQGTYTLMLKRDTVYQAQGYYLNLLGGNLADTLRDNVTISSAEVATWTQDVSLQTGAVWSGQVADQLGRPVHLAQVRAYSAASNLPALTALTDDQGHYQILGLSSGAYTLDIQADGYAPYQTNIQTLIGNRTLAQNYTLVANTSIAGVVSCNHQPLGGAVVQVLDTGNALVLQTGTGANGVYLAEPLSGGPFQVKVSAVGLKSQTRPGISAGERADFDLAPLIGHEEAISYPNPCRGRALTFLCWLDNDATVLVRVYNQAGELVWDQESAGSGGGYHKQTWNVEGVAPGVYLFKFTAREANGNRRTWPTGKLTVIK